MGRETEWAVIERQFRGYICVARGALASREEAEAHKRAMDLTNARVAGEALHRSDSIMNPARLMVASREFEWQIWEA